MLYIELLKEIGVFIAPRRISHLPDFVQKQPKRSPARCIFASTGLKKVPCSIAVFEFPCISVAVARPLHYSGFAGPRQLILLLALIFANQAFVAAQYDSIYRLPAGTRIRLRLDVELSSKVASIGDTFLASVARPVINRDAVVVPVGQVIEGNVAGVRHAGTGGKGGSLDLRFEKLQIAGRAALPIEGTLVRNLESRSPQRGNVLRIVGGTIVGSLIGAATRSTGGALIGAGIGGGAGTGAALLRKGKDVRIGRNEEFEIVLRKEVVLPVLDY